MHTKPRVPYVLGPDDTLEPFVEPAPPWLMRAVWGGMFAVGVAFWSAVAWWLL